MKTRIFFLSLLAIVLMCACKNEATDYQKAMKSVDADVMQNYLLDFPDAPAEHRDSVSARMMDIISDNADYECIFMVESIIDKHKYAKEYLAKHENGLHVTEVEVFIKNTIEDYEMTMEAIYEQKYGEYRDRLVNFKYDGSASWLVFEAPDFDGKGKGVYYGRNIFGSGYTQLTYEINKRGELIVTAGETTDGFSCVTGLFIVTVYRDCIYIEKGGDLYCYQRELITDSEYQELLDKYNF